MTRFNKSAALIIVDLQSDFLPGGALPVPEGDQVIPLANRLQQQFDLVVATQDWHPPNHVSFAANHKGKKPGDVIRLGETEQILWPVHCVQNTPGAQLAPNLETGRIQRVFQKGTDPAVDGYSGFYDNQQQRSTGLGEFLREQGVDEVYVLGLATDVCVLHTVLDARRLGFRTNVVVDACRGIDLNEGDVRRALEKMQQAGAQLVQSRQSREDP